MSRKYSKEFTDPIVQMIKDGANARDLSDEYGPNYKTIRRWGHDNYAVIDTE